MRLSRMGCVLLALLLFTSAATALGVDLDGEKEWLIAGGDSAGLSMEISGGSDPFTITAATNGLCSVTPPSQTVTTTTPTPLRVTPGTTSGVCQIDVTVTDKNGHRITEQFFQKIDHAPPYNLTVLYDPKVTVGTFAGIITLLQDRYFNRVDNRNEVENITFLTTARASGFADPSAAVYDFPDLQLETEKDVPVDENGSGSLLFFVGEPGANWIRVTPPATVLYQTNLFSIYGMTNGEPATISTEIDPAAATPPWVYADGTSHFTITYTLTDPHGYPCESRNLFIQTPLGDRTLRTNGGGQVSFTYPSVPVTTPGIHTLTATAVDNASATTSDDVEFISGRAVTLMLSANPIAMPSLDVEPGQFSEINGRVSDIKGNPKEGETVTFELKSIDAPVGNVSQPYLTDTGGKKYELNSPFTVRTDGEGTALMYFHPGAFQTDTKAKDFNVDATGTAVVKASWNGKTEEITVTWKNTPFLSISTEVSPKVLRVDDTFTVTITVKGNGAKLSGLPVDVILVIDNSASMWWQHVDGRVRVDWMKPGVSDFLDSLDPGKDRVGVVVFDTRGSLEMELTSDFDGVEKRVQDLTRPKWEDFVPFKGPNGASNLRDGLYKAIKHMEQKGRSPPGAVRAIVVLSDGEFNWYGTPLAQGRGYALTTKILKCYNFEGSNCAAPSTVTDAMWWPGLVMPSDYTYYNDLGGPLVYTGDECRDRLGHEVGGSCGDLCYPSYTGDGTRFTGNWLSSGVNNWWTTHKDPCSLSNYRIQICKENQCLFTRQNMSIYANSANTEIYTIAFAENYNVPPYTVTRDILSTLSGATGGSSYMSKGQDLSEIYKKIGKDLIRSAGIKTELKPDNENIKVGSEVVARGVYEYVYVNTGPKEKQSTSIYSWNYTAEGAERAVFERYTYDHRQDWLNNQMKFNLGTMTIGQVWQAKYTLRAKKPGWAEVFGPASALTFRTPDGQLQTVPFPQQNITVLGKDEVLHDAFVDVFDSGAVLDGNSVTSVPEDTSFDVAWMLDYRDDDNGRAHQWYTIEGVSDPTFSEGIRRYPTREGPTVTPKPYSLTKMNGIKDAGVYRITVFAEAEGNRGSDDDSFLLTVGHKDETAVIILR